jgi:hypothetical protein
LNNVNVAGKIHNPSRVLEIERKAEFKSEYFNGEMFAKAGGTGLYTYPDVSVVWRC